MRRLIFICLFIMLCGCRIDTEDQDNETEEDPLIAGQVVEQMSAPDDLEGLLGYLFQHAADEDPVNLESGVIKLHAWFQDDGHLERSLEGIDINRPSAEVLESLELVEETEHVRSNSALKGVHAATVSPHCVRRIVGLFTWGEYASLWDSFEIYELDFDRDPSCMIDRSCLNVTAHRKTRSNWANLISITTEYQMEFRWVDTPIGWVLMHRSWLKHPAPGDRFDFEMKANYYIGITMPDTGSGSLRIHANWFDLDTGSVPLSESAIASAWLQDQKVTSASHDDMISNNDIPGECGGTP